MAKFKQRLLARSMRREGVSIIVIARKLQVSKSSVSTWCSDISLSEKQYEKLRLNMGVSLKTGQRMGAEVNKQRRLDRIMSEYKEAKNIFRKVSKRDLLVAAVCLYWAEGAKTHDRFTFVNSDPAMLKTMLVFLTDIIGIPKEQIRVALQINIIHKKRVGTVTSFWSDYLNIPLASFGKPYFVKVLPKKVYENYDTYYGILRLRVLKGSGLQYKMLGLIRVLKEHAGIAQLVRAPHS